jgi:hypothetical protein
VAPDDEDIEELEDDEPDIDVPELDEDLGDDDNSETGDSVADVEMDGDQDEEMKDFLQEDINGVDYCQHGSFAVTRFGDEVPVEVIGRGYRC